MSEVFKRITKDEANLALYAVIEGRSSKKQSRNVSRAEQTRISEALTSGADVNFLCDERLPGWDEKDELKGTGNSALHLACWLGLDKALIDRLLYIGADVHLKSRDGGYLPIHTATNCGNVELVEFLLDKDCDPNSKDIHGSTSLMWASLKGHKEIVELLLDRGADISDRDDNGSTSLMLASSKSHKEVIELLLDRGADINVKNVRGSTSLTYSCRVGNKEIVELLLNRGANVNDIDENGVTPFLSSVKNRNFDLLQYLIIKGANINATERNTNKCALLLSLEKGYTEIFDFLLKNGANVSAIDADKDSLLHSIPRFTSILGQELATKITFDVMSSLESVPSRLEKVINYRNKYGNNCIHSAIFHGNMSFCEIVLSKAPKNCIDSINLNGDSPLMMAAILDRLDICNFLIAKGASAKITDHDNNSLLHVILKDFSEPSSFSPYKAFDRGLEIGS